MLWSVLCISYCYCWSSSLVKFIFNFSSKETQKFAERAKERSQRAGRSSGVHQDRTTISTASSAADRETKDSSTGHKSTDHTRPSNDRLGHAHQAKPGRSDKSPAVQARSDNTRLSPAPEASGSGGSAEEVGVRRPRLYTVSQDHFGKILNKASSVGEFRKCPEVCMYVCVCVNSLLYTEKIMNNLL